MRAFLFSLFVVCALTVDASSSEKKPHKRGIYHPQHHGSVYAGGLTSVVHGHGNNHGFDLGHGYGHGGFAQGGGLVLGGQSHGVGLGYGHGFGYNHHEKVVNHVVKVPVPVPHPVAVHRDVPVPVPHIVPVVVKRPVKIPVPHPVPVVVQKPYHVPVNRPVPVYVPTPVHVPHPVPVPVAVHDAGHHHLHSGPSHAVPLVHSHVPFKSDFGDHGFGHGSAGHFDGHFGGHGGHEEHGGHGGHEHLHTVSLPSKSYGFPTGKAYRVDTPVTSYGVPTSSYGAPNGDFSDNHSSATFGSALAIEHHSHGGNDGYDYPVPSKKFL